MTSPPVTAERRRDADELLALALSRPPEALASAQRILASRPDAYAASVAHQTLAIVQRDRGEVAAAVSRLHRALTAARATGSIEREGDVRATLGVTLAIHGRTAQGLAHLDAAVAASRGAAAGRILARRAMVLVGIGRYPGALADLNAALAALRRTPDPVWQARTLTWRAGVHVAMGAHARAAADYDTAEELFAGAGQELEFAMARHNRGMFAAAQGDLPRALEYLAEAARRYEKVGVEWTDLAIDRSTVLLSAGLPREALEEADRMLASMHTTRGQSSRRAELLYAAARAAVAVPDPAAAVARARPARRLFRSQGRQLWRLRSELTLGEAQFAAGTASSALLRRLDSLAVQLSVVDLEQGQRAHLLAGRVALTLGRPADAHAHLSRAALVRRGSPPLVRSVGWLARALRAQSFEDAAATVAACRSGLAALDEHLLTLGSTELRAHATTHGAELAAIAQREALRAGSPRRLLAASERWRAASARHGISRARLDHEVTESLTRLRAVVGQLDSNRTNGRPTAELERERRRIEGAIRERSLHAGATAVVARPALDTRSLRDALGERRLVELVEVDGILHAVTVVGARVRRHGRAALPIREVEHARFMLRRLAQGAPRWDHRALLDELGRQLQESLLGPAVDDLGTDAPVVLVPPGTLHAVPWALLPALRYREVSVMPSAAALLRIHEQGEPPGRRVTFAAGPGLGSGAGEVTPLAALYPGATVLADGSATVNRVLEAMDGAWLTHIAAHGTFRADNPLFSALQLDDGPLTVHDFERLGRAPYRLLLPCCDSGVATPVGADELLGLVSSLFPLGSAGVLASVVPINDEATVPLMLAVHAALRSGATLAAALLQARRAAGDDPVATATGYSFIAFGV